MFIYLWVPPDNVGNLGQLLHYTDFGIAMTIPKRVSVFASDLIQLHSRFLVCRHGSNHVGLSHSQVTLCLQYEDVVEAPRCISLLGVQALLGKLSALDRGVHTSRFLL